MVGFFFNVFYRGSMVVWGFRGKAQPPLPPKNPDCCLHQSYRLGSSCSLQLDLAVLRALPFWQVVLRGASLPPVTLGWDVGTAAGGWGQQTLLWHGEDGEGWGNRGIVWGFL